MINTVRNLILTAVFFCSFVLVSMADQPPDPGGGPGTGDDPVGGGAPIGGSLLILLSFDNSETNVFSDFNFDAITKQELTAAMG